MLRPPARRVDKHREASSVVLDRRRRYGALPNPALERANRVGRLAAEQHPTFRDDRHTLAKIGDVLDDMGRQNHDHVLADFGEQVQEAIALLRVESGGRLIHDHQSRAADQCLGDAEPLAHAAGESAEPAFTHVPQVHLMQQRLDQRLALAACNNALEHGEMLEHRLGGDPRINPEFLRQIAEQASRRRLVGQHIEVVQANAAGIRILQRRDGAHQS